ncbi:CobW family GTP-binding protein [Candidatus Poriferisodalis sp.]|uniref:CobW family GTP-binding protein n=1 Tax=Candidatus Poriferisodalis sp. TaxID=3101277 RepID=UPI003B017ADF
MNAETNSGDWGPLRAQPGGIDEFDAAWQATVGSIAAARRQTGDGGAEAVGVTVLTGFLGSGKTTVLRRLLTEPAGLRIAAVVNDIGPVNIDAAALEGLRVASRTPDRVELTNGCACCALVDDLAETLEALAGAQTSDAIVVEASGVADPATLALAVEGAAGCTLDGVVAVVDAQQLASQLSDPRVGPAVRRQIDVAHLVVLSKVDLAGGDEVAALTDQLSRLAPGRMVVPAVHGRIDPRLLLGAALRGATFPADAGEHPFEVASAVVTPTRPWEVAEVARWFESSPPDLMRAKGWFASPDGSSHELQAVGRSWRIMPAAGAHDPAIVLICSSQEAVDSAAASLRNLD